MVWAHVHLSQQHREKQFRSRDWRNVRVLTDRWRGNTCTKSTETGQRGVSYRWASAIWRANCLMGSKCGNRNKSGELPHDGKSRPFFPWSDRELDSNTQNKEMAWYQRLAESNSDWVCSFQLALWWTLAARVEQGIVSHTRTTSGQSTKTEVGWKQLEVEKIEIWLDRADWANWRWSEWSIFVFHTKRVKTDCITKQEHQRMSSSEPITLWYLTCSMQ